MSNEENKTRMRLSFADKIQAAAENAVISLVSSGGWVHPDYHNRIKIDASVMQSVWELVDLESLKLRLKERIEAELADRVMNHLASEMATDVKTILSNKDRREALRAVARENLDAIIGASAERVSP